MAYFHTSILLNALVYFQFIIFCFSPTLLPFVVYFPFESYKFVWKHQASSRETNNFMQVKTHVVYLCACLFIQQKAINCFYLELIPFISTLFQNEQTMKKKTFFFIFFSFWMKKSSQHRKAWSDWKLTETKMKEKRTATSTTMNKKKSNTGKGKKNESTGIYENKRLLRESQRRDHI